MHTWEDVIACKSGVCALERNRSVQNAYDRKRRESMNIYESYEDKVMIELMSYQRRKSKRGKFIAVRSKNSADALLIKNEYPYNLEKNVLHYVLFSQYPLTERGRRALITKMLGHGFQYETVVNDIGKMSMPNIWHCHVFIKTS